MQLVTRDDPILHRVCRPDFSISRYDISQMFILMRVKNGLGLAAPQVGIDARLFVTDWDEVYVNPVIAQRFGTFTSGEGCLSLPGVTWQRKRNLVIVLADGRTYDSQKAVVIQHEIDHLDGILITD